VKKILLAVFLVFVVFVVVERQRLFLRDPLASVMRDGVKEDGTQVFINYNNDVLLEHDGAPMYVTLVEHANHVGTPKELKCLHWMACLMDADVATLVDTSRGVVVDSMTGKSVEWHEGKQDVVVTLR